MVRDLKKSIRPFRDYLHQYGLLFTPKKELILQEIFRFEDHFSTEDLALAMNARSCKVSRATLYRAC